MNIKQIITDYIMRSILETQGDMIVRGAAVPEKLVGVVVGRVLKSGGVGAKPVWSLPNIGDGNTADGYQAISTPDDHVITGVGFQPKLIFLFASQDGTNPNFSIGIDDGLIHLVLALRDAAADAYIHSNYSIYVRADGSNYMSGTISALGSDGFTMTIAETGTMAMTVYWFAIG